MYSTWPIGHSLVSQLQVEGESPEEEYASATGWLAGKVAKMDNHIIRIMCPNLRCQRVLGVPGHARGQLIRCRSCCCKILVPEVQDQIVQGKLVGQDSVAKEGA